MAKDAKVWHKKSGKAPKPAKRPSQSATTLAGAAAAAIAAVCFGVSRFTLTNPVSTMEQPPPIDRKPRVQRKPGVEKQAASARPVAPTPDPKCADKAPECGQWASIGECVANPGFMMVSCASSCDMCDMQDYRKRCAVDETVPLSVPPGAMDATFRHASSAFASLEPVVLSSDPWVLQFDAFLSDDEADALIRGGAAKGWALSEDAGAMRSDGSFEAIRSSHRTSMTAWCDTAACQADAHIQRVMERAENVTRVPQANSEFVQVLQYEVGQYYGGHHDFIPAHSRLPCGPRVYTLFMYLSEVEEGGETEFERLGIRATPKKGRALLWPSTFDARPLEQDHRTFHEAKPVIRGTKHAANMWLHQFDFKKAHRLGCSG